MSDAGENGDHDSMDVLEGAEEAEEASYTVGMPRSVMPTAPVRGSILEDCCADDCDNEVWLSPATQNEIESGVYPDAILCLTCARDRERERQEDDAPDE